MRFIPNKRQIFIFIFILLLLLCKSIYLYILDLNSTMGFEKLTIRLKDNIVNIMGFSNIEIKELNRILSEDKVNYYLLDDASVSSEQGFSHVQVYGVLGNYNEFNKVKLKIGSFINENDNDLYSNVVVIDDVLAESLFKSRDVIGLNIFLYNESFKIIGTIATRTNFIEKLIGEKSPSAYIPFSTMADLMPNMHIENVEYLNRDGGFDVVYAEDKISAIGKDIDSFYIEDLNTTSLLLRQQYDILIFLLGLYSIYILISLTLNIIRSIMARTKEFSDNYYFRGIIKAEKHFYFFQLLIIIAVCILGVFIWKQISFKLYIQPENIPDNPANIAQIINIISKRTIEFINLNYSYSVYIVELSRYLQGLSIFVFILGLLSEILLINLLKKNEEYNYISQLIKDGIILITSIIISSIIIYLLGLPIIISPGDMIIIWICFVVIILFNKSSRHLNTVFHKI